MHADHFGIHITCSCLLHQLSDSHDIPSLVNNKAAWAEKGIALCSVFVAAKNPNLLLVSLLVWSSSVGSCKQQNKMTHRFHE